MHNAKYDHAERAIKAALVECMKTRPVADITVTTLASAAGISRNTFYAHYSNVMEAYYALSSDIDLRIQRIDEHFGCSSCPLRDEKSSFCDMVRSSSPAGAVTRDPAYLDFLFNTEDLDGFRMHLDTLASAGLPEDVARVIRLFHIGGCYIAATHADCSERDWKRYKSAIDRFVKGGMEALGVRFPETGETIDDGEA